MTATKAYPVKTRIFLATLCLVLLLAGLAGILSIPFFYPSSSILYKFGTNKLLLRCGKLVGLTAATLLCLQALLISRFAALERIFPGGRVLAQHRTNGLIIAGLVLLHPFLIVGSENFTLYTLEKRYWPEFVGAGLLAWSLIVIVAARWRSLFKIRYQQWRIMHGIAAFLLLIMLFVHILFVSESFARGLPRRLIFMAATLNLLLILRIWYRRMFSTKKPLAPQMSE